jgi:glutamate--cysteine ligase
VLPPLHAGWAVRRKTQHFQAYEEVAKKFAKLLGMDPWLINPMFSRCGEVNFSDGTGQDCLMTHAEALLAKVRRKYKEYGIQEKPFLIVKADAGTYGMGIMTVRDPKDLADLNRRTRNKMSIIKDGQEVSEVILQEASTASMPSAAWTRTSTRRAPASCPWRSLNRPTCPARASSRVRVCPTASTCTA